MNYKTFAEKYLQSIGVDDKSSMYGGLLGESLRKMVAAFSGEGHSGNSAHLTNEIFYDLNNAYSSHGMYEENENRHQIWSEYWNSPEGQKLQADTGKPGLLNEPLPNNNYI